MIMETFSTTEDMKIEFSKINGNLNQLIVLQPFTNSEDPSNIIGDDQTLMLGEPSLVDIRLLSPTEETTLERKNEILQKTVVVESTKSFSTQDIKKIQRQKQKQLSEDISNEKKSMTPEVSNIETSKEKDIKKSQKEEGPVGKIKKGNKWYSPKKQPQRGVNKNKEQKK